MNDIVIPVEGGVRIALRVIPRSSKAGVDGIRDGRLLVRVTAPPVDDAANDAVVEVMARALRVPRRAVKLAAGATSRNKVVVATGRLEAEVRALLGLGPSSSVS